MKSVSHQSIFRLPRFRSKHLSIYYRSVVALLGCVMVSCSSSPISPPNVQPLPRSIGNHSRETQRYQKAVQVAPDRFVLKTGSQLLRKRGAPDVELVGVVHLGTPAYYRALDAKLSRSDLVLYEGLVDRPDSPTKYRNSEDRSGTAFYLLAKRLNLVLQDSVIDVFRPNFRRCDLSILEMNDILEHDMREGGDAAEIAREAKEEFKRIEVGLDKPSIVARIGFALMTRSPASREMLKLRMIAIDKQRELEAHVSSRLVELMVDERDKHVVAEVGRLRNSKRQRISVYYGVGHLPGIEKGLKDIGYRPVGPVEWHEAFSASPYAAGVAPQQVASLIGAQDALYQ